LSNINRSSFFIPLIFTNLFSQTGGENNIFKKLSINIGMNQIFYGKDWNNFVDSLDSTETLTQNPLRKFNFTFIKEFEEGMIGGIRQITYGYDIKLDTEPNEYNDYETLNEQLLFHINILKLFLTYPMGQGLYIGFEGGYF